MRVKVFVLIAIIYFFFNSFGLPLVLTYLMLLSPLFFLNTIQRYFKFYLFFGAMALFYFVAHSLSGIENSFEYFKSLTLHFIVAIIAVSFFDQLKRKPFQVAHTIEVLAILNMIAMVFALFVIAVPVIGSKIWRISAFGGVKQLRILVYEPSYYALLLVPIFFYFYGLILSSKSVRNIFLFSTVVLSFLLSRSLGVIAAIVLSIAIYYWDFSLLKKKKNLYIAVGFFGLGSIVLICLFVFFPEYVLVQRTLSFLKGEDISGLARVLDPWTLGAEILQQKNSFFGIGWGHIKILGHEIISEHYNYGKSLNIRVTIPNASAEIFIPLGYLGLLIKIFLEIYLYKKTKVKYSRFRSLIFWFIFVYQFTGSFSSNLAEYVLWILAFTKVEEFDFAVQRVLHLKFSLKNNTSQNQIEEG